MKTLEDQPLADARGRSTTKDKVALLADKLFDEDPRIKHLLAGVLQQLRQQEDEIHRLQCISQQRQRDIQRQEDEIHKLREELDAFREEVALERAYDRQRISRLENPSITATPSEKTEGHIDHVRALLLKADFHRETVKFLSSRLGVSKRQTWNIIYEMERQGLVNVIWDPHHKQRRLVELRQMI